MLYAREMEMGQASGEDMAYQAIQRPRQEMMRPELKHMMMMGMRGHSG